MVTILQTEHIALSIVHKYIPMQTTSSQIIGTKSYMLNIGDLSVHLHLTRAAYRSLCDIIPGGGRSFLHGMRVGIKGMLASHIGHKRHPAQIRQTSNMKAPLGLRAQ